MLTSWQNVPRTIFMQISAAITENSFVGHISVNNNDNWTNKVSTPMLWGAEIMEIPWNTISVVTNWVFDVFAM